MSGIEIIRPKDRAAWLAARGRDVTASVVGALFGEHEYTTEFELWAVKTGRAPRLEQDSPQMERGRLLEPVGVQLLRERHPKWKIAHNAAENIYFRDPVARLGATPDVIVTKSERGVGAIQIKSVEASIYRRKWLDDEGEPEPPLWIALQATLEAHLVGAQWAAVAPLVVGHGLDMPLIDIPIVPGVVDAMKARAAEFWQMVEEGREPQPDYSRDGAIIDRIYSESDDEHEVDLSGEPRIRGLLEARATLKAAEREAKSEIEKIDAEIKAAMGTAAVAHLGDGRRITWRTRSSAGKFIAPSKSRVLQLPK